MRCELIKGVASRFAFLENFSQNFSSLSFVICVNILHLKSTILVSPWSDSLRRRANARNVSFRISLRWLTYIVNSVDKTKLSYDLYNLVFFYLSKQILSGFLQFKGNFVRDKDNSKYHD